MKQVMKSWGDIMHKDTYFDSCGKGRIHVCRWEPEGKPRAIIQIVHGIAEYAQRYAHFAEFLTAQGFLVVAEDHMGHGGSITKQSEKGCLNGGWFAMVKDTYRLLQHTKAEFPDLPYVLFGHSMGSFMVRTILEKYPDSGIATCIICGTGWLPELVVKAGLMACKGVIKIHGKDKHSKLLQKLVFAGYNKKVEHPKSAYDWLNRDQRAVMAYEEDPLCGFIPSAGLLEAMLTGILYIQNEDNLKRMKRDLPVYFIAGGADPVGDFGNGVRKAVAAFEACRMQLVACHIYPMCRHEIMNEINWQEVYDDILAWMEKFI